MIRKYLGETIVHQRDTPFKGYGPSDWAMEFIGMYGGIEGEHHKTWMIDQVARILNGAPVEIKLARWDDGHEEYRKSVSTSERYKKWVKEMCEGEDGPKTWDWDVGIAP